jgi:hypothetical protein
MMQDLMTFLTLQLLTLHLKGPFIGLVDGDHGEIPTDHDKGSIMGIHEVIQFNVLVFQRLPLLRLRVALSRHVPRDTAEDITRSVTNSTPGGLDVCWGESRVSNNANGFTH